MTSTHEVSPTAFEPESGHSSSDSPRADRRSWRWLLAALVSAATVIGAGLWWLLDSTVPVSDYDAVVAELDASEEALARSRTELSAAQAELADFEEALNSEEIQLALNFPRAWTKSEAELRARFATAEPAALLLGYFAGVDPEIVDQEEYESWAGVVELDTALEAVDDPMLTELYWEHMGAGGFSPGSEELVLRLIEVTIEPILEGR